MANDPGDFTMSYFPSPPPFWRDFTPENQERLKAFQKEHLNLDPASSSETTTSLPTLTSAQLLQLPPELRNLVPPSPPSNDTSFRVFNQITKAHGIDDFASIMDFISTDLAAREQLPDWTFKRLYPSPSPSSPTSTSPSSPAATFDRQAYLLRFLRSILLNYLELLGLLAVDPTSPAKDQKLREILNLVANAHALVNEYRPHQARETLIRIMEAQLARKKAEIEGVRVMREKIEETLAGFQNQVPPRPAVEDQGEMGRGEREERMEGQRAMWRALEEGLGC